MTPHCDKRIFDAPTVSRYFRFKRPVDFTAVFFIALILAPLISVFILLVRLTSRGPIFYVQERCGKDGKTFKMYKIRSMIVDAEINEATWSPQNDSRITSVGKVMRKLHIDELVQLYNVLWGDMALVGPRPERPEFIEKLEKEVPGYKNRMLVPPGMSGFSQLIYPADTTVEDVRRKLVLDLEYIETASFWLDMRMLAATAFQFLCVCAFRICGVKKKPVDTTTDGYDFPRHWPLKVFGVYRQVDAKK